MAAKSHLEFQKVAAPVAASPETTGGAGGITKTVEEQAPVQVPVDGPARPGDLLVIQVQGLAQVRVSVGAGPIKPGDLLTSGPGGLAQRAEPRLALDGTTLEYTAGTILGKALEAWEGGDGLIWVLIDLR
jgi:hypothetical protein